MEIFEIGELLRVPVRKLSLGERMRCEIAAALLHAPRLLLLDEPTIGLDVVAKQRIRDLVRRLNKEEGLTVLKRRYHSVRCGFSVSQMLWYLVLRNK